MVESNDQKAGEPRPVVASLVLFLVLLRSSGFVVADEGLPLLDGAWRLDGTPSPARFLAAARIAGQPGFSETVLSQDVISLHAEIQVEPAHVGEAGNLYLVVALDDRYFQRTSTGIYLPWDTKLESLQPAASNKLLAASEPLIVFEDLRVGDLWLAGHTVHFFFAYDLTVAPGQLIYSPTPFSLHIESYHPLHNGRPAQQVIDTSFVDPVRQRQIPLLIFLPETPEPGPVILFSHGLGGSRFAAGYLGEHWSSRGYVVVFMQHAGSDVSILDGVPPLLTAFVLNQAASAENLWARILDVSAVIEQLQIWNDDSSHALFSRLDLLRIGMSGHSFGARTTQLVSGESLAWAGLDSRDYRIDAALALSPSITAGIDPDLSYSAVGIPWMLMTGTLDIAAIGDTTVADRLAVYPALPPVGKYELVLFEGEHHAFSDRPLSPIQTPRNPAHHPIIMALSTAFWDAWLTGSGDAVRWLEGEGARSMLQPLDGWQFK